MQEFFKIKNNRKKRDLSQQEQALWQKATVNISRITIDTQSPVRVIPKIASHPGNEHGSNVSSTPTINPNNISYLKIEKSYKSKILKGDLPIDATLDLHGFTQVAAHARLKYFILNAQARHARLVRVITGIGRKRNEQSPGSSEMGILRKAVPVWLMQADIRHAIIGFENAHPRHGGEGALYIRIRQLKNL